MWLQTQQVLWHGAGYVAFLLWLIESKGMWSEAGHDWKKPMTSLSYWHETGFDSGLCLECSKFKSRKSVSWLFQERFFFQLAAIPPLCIFHLVSIHKYCWQTAHKARQETIPRQRLFYASSILFFLSILLVPELRCCLYGAAAFALLNVAGISRVGWWEIVFWFVLSEECDSPCLVVCHANAQFMLTCSSTKGGKMKTVFWCIKTFFISGAKLRWLVLGEAWKGTWLVKIPPCIIGRLFVGVGVVFM